MDKKTFFETELVQQHLRLAADQAAAFYRDNFVSNAEARLSLAGGVESPAEAVFWLWWESIKGDDVESNWEWRPKVILRPQVDITVEGRRFRHDFSVEPDPSSPAVLAWSEEGLKWKGIAVEVDGHTFHEKTLEQVTLRNERDRLLQQADWRVFHFSFSELVTRRVECAMEVLLYAHLQFHDMSYQLHLAERAKGKE